MDDEGLGRRGGSAPSALPSSGARVAAFVAILVGGACGGLIGYAVADLQCSGDCTTLTGAAGLLGAVVGAAGVAVIAVLVLRAMGEWHTIRQRDDPDGPGRA
ncbi:hypothetical protein BH20ACT2_BH20ACT2_03780 [soil metagenome]